MTKTNISMIAAIADNNLLGKDGSMPWHLPKDLAHFKKLTTNKVIIMGRKTYESIGRPLPNRENIVLTRDKKYMIAGANVCHNIQDALALAKSVIQKKENITAEIMIMGGAQLYKQAINLADTLYITHIDQKFNGDCFFPSIDPTVWTLVDEAHDACNDTNLRFCTYKKLAGLS